MRLAVLSDIHANIYAFEAVVKDLRREKPDQVIFLGDLIINGLYPRECWDLLSDLDPDLCIKGNTDGFHEYFLMNPEPTGPKEQYAQLLDAYAAAQVPGSALDEISSWKIFEQRLMEEEPIGFCHGTPLDFEEKMTEDDLSDSSKRQILDLELQTLFCGHTHQPGAVHARGHAGDQLWGYRVFLRQRPEGRLRHRRHHRRRGLPDPEARHLRHGCLPAGYQKGESPVRGEPLLYHRACSTTEEIA